MKDYLDHHHVRITALAPIHVGDGKKIGKKEYIQLKGIRGPVIIPDMIKMVETLEKYRLIREYESFMLNGKDLGAWLLEKHIPKNEIEKWTRYTMNPGEGFVKKSKDTTQREIMSFVKDAYNKPFIPGSTLKGMLRNAILCYRITQDREKYDREVNQLAFAANGREKRTKFLLNETKHLEAAVFNTLERKTADRKNAVNSIMSGFIVSDSTPIEENQLILAQKIDYSLKGVEKTLPILREAIKPGTQIDFEITIDRSICDIKVEEIVEALKFFNKISNEYFYSKFHRGNMDDDTVWLGGGTGFLSKTLLYPVFGKSALGIADKTFKITLNGLYHKHKHDEDKANGVSPHCCKCTRYNGKLYDMGMGRIEILD